MAYRSFAGLVLVGVACSLISLWPAESKAQSGRETIGQLNYKKCAGDQVRRDIQNNDFGRDVFRRGGIEKHLSKFSSVDSVKEALARTRDDQKHSKENLSNLRKYGSGGGVSTIESIVELNTILISYYECLSRQSWPQQKASRSSSSASSSGLSCISIEPSFRVNSIVYRIQNRCQSDLNVSICTRLSDAPLPPTPDFTRVKAKGVGERSVFNPDNKAYKFEYRACTPPKTMNTVSNCASPCPAAFSNYSADNPFGAGGTSGGQGGFSSDNPFAGN